MTRIDHFITISILPGFYRLLRQSLLAPSGQGGPRFMPIGTNFGLGQGRSGWKERRA